MIEKIQPIDQPVDIAEWRRHEEYEQYPEGAREKTLIYCPQSFLYSYLIPGHQYLFKRSPKRYPEQFWVEIFAYRLGMKMQIPVPPAFVAYDSKRAQSGALIEWFYKPPNGISLNDSTDTIDSYTPGGDLCEALLPDYDRKYGEQHNFETIENIFNVTSKILINNSPVLINDWKEYWAKAFVFDALIGNTDRHQDNWGIIENVEAKSGTLKHIRISPVFDNGTSMGHEIQIPSNKFKLFGDDLRLQAYIIKGKHHIKWRLNDSSGMQHCELLKKLIEFYSDLKIIMLSCLNSVNNEIFKKILDDLTAFNVPIRLSVERAAFMLRLLNIRHQYLLRELEN